MRRRWVSTAALEVIRRCNEAGENDASWLRAELKSGQTLNDVVRRQSHLWVTGNQAATRSPGQ